MSDPITRPLIIGLQMNTDDLLQHLRGLEVALHQPDVRRDPVRRDQLLHESFAEFRRSGRSYSRTDILEFCGLKSPGPIWSQDFAVAEIAEDIALLTYKSAHVDANGELCRHTIRSSLWQRTTCGWQMPISPRYADRFLFRGTQLGGVTVND